MKKLNTKGVKWLKVIHLFFVGLWVGSSFSIVLLIIFLELTVLGDVYGFYLGIKLVDDFVIIPGAVGAMLTGLVYGIWTKWGFFKHNWLKVKWILNIALMLTGTFLLGPAVNQNTALAKAQRVAVLQSEQFINNQQLLIILGTAQLLLLLFMLFVSTFKPWKKKRRTEPA